MAIQNKKPQRLLGSNSSPNEGRWVFDIYLKLLIALFCIYVFSRILESTLQVWSSGPASPPSESSPLVLDLIKVVIGALVGSLSIIVNSTWGSGPQSVTPEVERKGVRKKDPETPDPGPNKGKRTKAPQSMHDNKPATEAAKSPGEADGP